VRLWEAREGLILKRRGAMFCAATAVQTATEKTRIRSRKDDEDEDEDKGEDSAAMQ
jgi:hypothetical protein